jgi:hypothetical protein
LKFLIAPNSLRTLIMTSFEHSYGIFLTNIFCHTFCSGRTISNYELLGTPRGLTVIFPPWVIIGVIVIGSSTR